VLVLDHFIPEKTSGHQAAIQAATENATSPLQSRHSCMDWSFIIRDRGRQYYMYGTDTTWLPDIPAKRKMWWLSSLAYTQLSFFFQNHFAFLAFCVVWACAFC
jgi:hypothetical protein